MLLIMRFAHLGITVADQARVVSFKVLDPDGYRVEVFWEDLRG
jgi:hypothetical protein